MAQSNHQSRLPQGAVISWVATQVIPQTIKLSAADQNSNRIIAPRTMCFLLDDNVDRNHLKQSIEDAVANMASEIPLLAGRVTWEDKDRSRIQVVIPEDPRVEVRFSNLPHLNARELDAEAWPPYKIRLDEQFMVDRGFRALENSCFALQANFMTGGFTLVFHMNHGVMDGTAFSVVVASFARHLSRAIDTSPAEFAKGSSEQSLDGSLVSNPSAGPATEQVSGTNDGVSQREQYNGTKTHTIWHMSQPRIEELCRMYRTHDLPGFRTSTVNCISILLWRVITKSRDLAPDSTTTATWAVDVRKRVRPALEASYIGNALCQGRLELQVRDLNKSPNEIALDMQKSTNSWNDSKIREYWAAVDQGEDLSLYKKSKDPLTTFDCTSLLNIPCYGLHWGNGIHPRRWRFPPVGLGDGFVAILPRLLGGLGIEISLHMNYEHLLKVLEDKTFRTFFTYCGGSHAGLADAVHAAVLS